MSLVEKGTCVVARVLFIGENGGCVYILGCEGVRPDGAVGHGNEKRKSVHDHS